LWGAAYAEIPKTLNNTLLKLSHLLRKFGYLRMQIVLANYLSGLDMLNNHGHLLVGTTTCCKLVEYLHECRIYFPVGHIAILLSGAAGSEGRPRSWPACEVSFLPF
jgi:hypothetical protein